MAWGEVDVIYGIRNKDSGKLVRGGNHYGYKTEGVAKSALSRTKRGDWTERLEIVELVPKVGPPIDKAKFSRLMYALTKDAARSSFVEYIEDLGISEDEYHAISKYLHETYEVKTYV